jgi:hypothetical protein
MKPTLHFAPLKSIGWREFQGERTPVLAAPEQARLDGRGLIIEAFYCEPDDFVEGPRPGRAGPSVLL